ncbi:MAG: MFS transporter [Cyclobacteriaceae bacterium]|nr:MFS transporter [Cyclobacteriaceae bacterium]
MENIKTSRRSYYKVGLVILIFFVISFFTNILGALNPSVSESYNLTKTMAGFLPFSFFIAYGVMSIPSGFLVEKYKEKKMLLLAFLLSLIGALVFASFPAFRVYMISLFTIGAGMAMLQVIINPLLRVAGGEENFAFFSVLAQLVFGSASFVSPKMYSWVVLNVHGKNEGSGGLAGLLNSLTPSDLSWAAVYWIFAIISLAMILLIVMTRFPKVELREDERVGTRASYLDLFKNKFVILFFLGIFAYVGTEQGVSYWMSRFLADYHGYDYETTGANAVANFWGLMTIGGILGLVLLKLFDSKVILRWFTFISMICLLLGLFGPRNISLYAFPAVGFFMSVMYPIIISLALNSVDKHHGSFAGILMTGIMGGAVVQLLIGGLADLISLKVGMMFNLVTMGYIFSIGIWAKPLIRNKVITLGKKKSVA